VHSLDEWKAFVSPYSSAASFPAGIFLFSFAPTVRWFDHPPSRAACLLSSSRVQSAPSCFFIWLRFSSTLFPRNPFPCLSLLQQKPIFLFTLILVPSIHLLWCFPFSSFESRTSAPYRRVLFPFLRVRLPISSPYFFVPADVLSLLVSHFSGSPRRFAEFFVTLAWNLASPGFAHLFSMLLESFTWLSSPLGFRQCRHPKSPVYWFPSQFSYDLPRFVFSGGPPLLSGLLVSSPSGFLPPFLRSLFSNFIFLCVLGCPF